MLIRRNELELLDHVNISKAKVLCLCPICGELSDTLTSDAIFDPPLCSDIDCPATMELLLVEVNDD